MFKELMNKVKADMQRKNKNQQKINQENDKIYPSNRVYVGEYIRKVIDNGALQYSYYHMDYFLANERGDKATSFLRLTGENADNSSVKVLSKDQGVWYSVEDGGITYLVDTHDESSAFNRFGEREFVSVLELIKNANYINEYSRERAQARNCKKNASIDLEREND